MQELSIARKYKGLLMNKAEVPGPVFGSSVNMYEILIFHDVIERRQIKVGTPNNCMFLVAVSI